MGRLRPRRPSRLDGGEVLAQLVRTERVSVDRLQHGGEGDLPIVEAADDGGDDALVLRSPANTWRTVV